MKVQFEAYEWRNLKWKNQYAKKAVPIGSRSFLRIDSFSLILITYLMDIFLIQMQK